jgi:hypothetical protein
MIYKLIIVLTAIVIVMTWIFIIAVLMIIAMFLKFIAWVFDFPWLESFVRHLASFISFLSFDRE